MKAELWAIFGFIMIVVIALSAGFVMANEFNLIAGSPGPYLNSDRHLNAYRIMMGAVAGFALAVINFMAAGKKQEKSYGYKSILWR